eukprot:166119_1
MILIDTDGSAVAFGMDAKYSYMTVAAKKDDWMLFERFKMSLYAEYKNDEEQDSEEDEKKGKLDDRVGIRSELTAVNGKTFSSELVFIAAFQHIQKEAKRFLKKKKIRNILDCEIQWIITVPAIWNDSAKDLMRQWTIKSGLVLPEQASTQCKIVYEPDCASLSILRHIGKFSAGDRYILVDAGGGTVDIACHEIIDENGVREIVHPTGGKWGSCYIDDQYIRLLSDIFTPTWVDEFRAEAPNGFVEITNDFQSAKSTFFADGDENTMYHNVRLPAEFLSFIEEKLEEVEDGQEEMDIEDFVGQYKIMGNSDLVTLNDEYLSISCMVWQSLFDVVMDPTIAHIKKLLNIPKMERCSYLCLVGGLSCSPYFQHEMAQEFVHGDYNLQLIIPQRPILSVVEGAAYFGLIKDYIKARVLRYSYGKTIIWPLQRAIQNGIPEAHIEQHKSWNKNANAYGVKGCFMTIAKKNAEVEHNQIFTTESHLFDPDANAVTINILCSDMEAPKVKDDGWRIAQLKLEITDEDRQMQNVKIITEFHFYDTTLHVFVYRSHEPHTKKEVQLNYAQIEEQ